MKCSKCQHQDTKVVESREVASGESIRRRRECLKCNHRYTTYERIERPQVVVMKKNGTRQIFDREKLMAGLERACEKTSVTTMQLEEVIANIETELYARGEKEVTSSDLGELIMEALAAVDEVAYVRFASVYRSFKDIESFERALDMIKRKSAQ